MSATNTPAFLPEHFAVQTSPELAGVIQPLLLMLFQEHEVFTSEVDGFPVFLTNPGLVDEQRRELARMLNELAQREEWARRGALLREVTDQLGTRLDMRVPQAPHAEPGIGLYGPFASEEAASEWVRDHAPYQLESDVFATAAGTVVELFRLA